MTKADVVKKFEEKFGKKNEEWTREQAKEAAAYAKAQNATGFHPALLIFPKIISRK